MESFAELLRRHRDVRSLTQEELARRAGITANAIGALERGERRKPYPHTVRALADALELEERERSALLAAASARHTSGVERTERAPATQPSFVAPLGPLVGRDDDVDALATLLRRHSRRVVTLTGPGGVGKTALALAVADRVRADFPGGVVVVELAEVVEPDEVVPAVAAALGAFVAGERVAPAKLAPALAGRRTLVLLDNLERVLDAAPALTELVALCPDLVLLVTSRAPLCVRHEREVRVGPLPHEAAVRLFHERVSASGGTLNVDPGTVAAVSTICHSADGLPLAVELAAAAAAMLGPTALLARLDAVPAMAPRDMPARQRTMSATLAWSHELLTPPARSLLARLSVCVGGFSLTAIEEIGRGDPSVVLASLVELLKQSLVTRVDPVEGVERFRLLEPIRQDASARLEPAERAEARLGLARAMLLTVDELAGDLSTHAMPAALRLLHADHGNLREAFEGLLDDDRNDEAADLLSSLCSYFTARGRAREGCTWAERLDGRPMSASSRLRWLTASASLTNWLGALAASQLFAEDALAEAERIGDDDVAAHVAAIGAWVATFSGRHPEARRLVARARAHGAHLASPHVRWQLVHATFWLAMEDDHDDAGADVQLRAAASDFGDRLSPFQWAVLRYYHSVVAERLGHPAESAAMLGDAVRVFVDCESPHLLAFVVPALGAVAFQLGELETGTCLFGAASRYIAELDIDSTYRKLFRPSHDVLARARAGLGEPAFASAWDAGRDTSREELTALARSLSDDSGS